MKTGDLVRPTSSNTGFTPLNWKGIIIGWKGIDPVVFWGDKFPNELEYREQIEVINELVT